MEGLQSPRNLEQAGRHQGCSQAEGHAGWWGSEEYKESGLARRRNSVGRNDCGSAGGEYNRFQAGR